MDGEPPLGGVGPLAAEGRTQTREAQGQFQNQNRLRTAGRGLTDGLMECAHPDLGLLPSL